jgi:proteic killer suppression protein
MIKSYRSKPLEKFATTGETKKLPVSGEATIAKLERQLAVLNASVKPEDMNLPGWGFHGLQGKPKRYAVKTTANYRLTYAWEETDAVDADLEDYH